MVTRKKTIRRSKKKPVTKQVLFPGIGKLLLFIFLFDIAIFQAGVIVSFVNRVLLNDQPITCLSYKSITVVKYNQSSSVLM